MDFESTRRNAAETTFPTATIKGFLFHFFSRIWKRYTLGMTEEEKNDPLLHQHVRRASTLPLVPLRQVEDIWFYALNNYKTDDAHVTSFNDYVTEQWVDREPERWNHFSTVVPRTTNHLEGWHHKLNNQLNKDHSNLFLIIQKLQNTQAATEIRLIQYAAVEDIWFYALNNYKTDDAHVTSFNDYVTEQWVDREPERWNHFSTVVPRTTNHLEGWHHKLNNQLNKDHSTVPHHTKLQNTQAANRNSLIQYAAGGNRKICKFKYRNIDNTDPT
ncbi:Hypothetical predicted protein [Mytilus galloprovincialis]|uniref:MULE transposase domain-containing protein n=1 Tax=Mytilus galloprovincialis TaxID=29158 RepID=A0A8B6F6R7_MYTGA|nr:Hypothetical predicted protein [Mytilus galloprovincialis]